VRNIDRKEEPIHNPVFGRMVVKTVCKGGYKIKYRGFEEYIEM